MSDVSKALVLPDVGAPFIESLLSMLLVWDTVVVPEPENWPEATYKEEYEATFDYLATRGAVTSVEVRVPSEFNHGGLREAAVRGWTAAGDKSRDGLVRAVTNALRDHSDRVADRQTARIRQAYGLCAQIHAAPVADGIFNRVGALLPPAAPEAPAREATLISVATSGVSVDRDTSAEDVLVFRERHRAAIGRFRAAMTDLAESLRREDSPQALVAEAAAIVANRVTPALGDLEDALKAGRVRFAWKTVLGASAVAAGPVTSGSTATAGSRIATRSLAYAFDRRRLIREHPYGFLHEASEAFPRGDATSLHPSFMARPITDPVHEMRRLWWVVVRAAFEPEIVKWVDAGMAGLPFHEAVSAPHRRGM